MVEVSEVVDRPKDYKGQNMDGTEAHDEVVPLHVEKVNPEEGATLPGTVQNI